ncbi:MAG: DUF4142 domain-containing protein [Proteobacteria bacterium]|nr:DUF4142 domain-containing protein [Pseudomonadota bacterium]
MRGKAWIPAAAGAALLAFLGLSALAIAKSAPADQRLLRLCAQGSIAEVELGQLATTRSGTPAVLSLGTRLAQDGSTGVASLQTLAAMLHVQLPKAPDATQKQQITKLRRLRGAAFDQRFERIASEEESKMLHQFQSGASTARSAAVRYTIRNMIPAVEEHLQIVKGLPIREATAATGVMR